jgi:hypothetical protein
LRRLQRKRRRPLFREKPSALLLPCHRSCHQSRTSRKRNARMIQIRAAESGTLLQACLL